MMLEPVSQKRNRWAPVSRQKPIAFPVEGWDTSSPLASMPPERAVQLRNWFPQASYGEIRRGYRYHAWDAGSDTASINSLMAWRGPASSKMFAASGTVIYDVTSNAAASSALTGLTNSRFQHVNMSTSAGNFLVICNGVDTVRHYNGSAWAAPSITGVASSDLIHVNAHKKRLWFTQKDTADCWYLPTEAIAGAATKFALGATFSRGGYLVAMATWTRDGGAGSDDYAVFVSSEGQCSVYQGTDPSSSTTWSLVGVFDVPSPIGRRCFVKYGADVALLTIQGVFPLSQLLSVDESQTRRTALSERITSALTSQAKLYGANFGWEMVVYPKGTRLIVNIPTTENSRAVQYVMNTLTGAWCEFSQTHGANCWLVYNDALYFGGNEGCVYKADTGSADIDDPITATGQSAYSAYSAGGVKHFKLVKPLVTSSGNVRPAIGVSTDFVETDVLYQPTTDAVATGGVWDSSRWDQSVWGGQDVNISDWVGVDGIGTFGSIKFQAQTGAQSGGSAWGVSLWGVDLWGSQGTADQTLRINGFLTMVEVGGGL